MPISSGGGSTIPSGPVLSDVRVDEQESFGHGMAEWLVAFLSCFSRRLCCGWGKRTDLGWLAGGDGR